MNPKIPPEFATEFFKEAVWWLYFKHQDGEVLHVSEGLQAYFDAPIHVLEDMTGCYNSPILRIKINEASAVPQEDQRFLVSFCTKKGKTSFQNRLKVFEAQGQRMVWSECVDVSEMVALERDIVDAQGRMSMAQMLERQAMLEDQNRLTQSLYEKQSRFLAFLSHELRSPLLGISSLSERLKLKYQAYPDIVEPLKVIHLTAQQATYLVSDILTYSQTQNKGMALRPVRFSLKDTLENVKLLTNSIAIDKGLMVSVIYDGAIDWVMGDSLRLSQVLINLIINGIKFSEFGGVTIEVESLANDQIMFSVTDSGEGMSADKLTQIFEPFAQLETVGGLAQNLGVGLGLYIVKQLVALMGGDVQVTSTPKVGTTFYFTLTLPAVQADGSRRVAGSVSSNSLSARVQQKKADKKRQQIQQPMHSNEAVQADTGSSSGEIFSDPVSRSYKILVADDSKINRMVLAGYLKDLNCQVIEAADGDQAWSLFEQDDFDYVFLDIQMPYLDGIDVCRRIKQAVNQGEARRLKGVYAITAGGEDAHVIPNGETFCSIGFNAWLIKPVSKQQIMQLFERPHRSAALQPYVCPTAVISSGLAQAKKNTVQHAIPLQGIETVPAQFNNLMEDFLSELKAGVQVLRSANKMADWKTLQAKAHYLKGNCMLFQLTQLVEQLRQVEKLPEEYYTLDQVREKILAILENIEIGIKYLENSWAIRHNGSN